MGGKRSFVFPFFVCLQSCRCGLHFRVDRKQAQVFATPNVTEKSELYPFYFLYLFACRRLPHYTVKTCCV